jgi:DNA-binding transcriptional MerR regulator
LNKAPDAFRTISEVAVELDLPQHVLRFWETRFPQIRPMKRGGGRRYYRPEDVDLLRGIRHLLYADGYTVRGVQRILREQGVRMVQSAGQGPEPAREDRSGPKTAHAVDPELPLSAARPGARDRQGGEMDRGEPERGEMDNGKPERGEMDNGKPERGEMDRGEMDRGEPERGEMGRGEMGRGEMDRGDPERGEMDSDEAAAPAAQSVAAATIDSAGDTGADGAVTASLDLERLKAALAELEECRRLLDRAVDGE